jgi:hypothetical protein
MPNVTIFASVFLLNDKQAVIYVEIMPGTLVSSETFPSPISQYMINVKGEERKSVIFSLDFLGGTAAQTISCTFVNQGSEYWIQILIFFGGILAGTGFYFIVSVIIECLKERLSNIKIEYD